MYINGKHLSDQDIHNRLKEIRDKEDELRKERHLYEEFINEQLQEKKAINRRKLEGKYFKLTAKGIPYRYKGMKAFRIDKVLENNDYAMCLIVIDNSEYDDTQLEYGVLCKKVGLWLPWNMTLKHMDNAMVIMDLYTEITKDEFEQIRNQTMKKLDIQEAI